MCLFICRLQNKTSVHQWYTRLRLNWRSTSSSPNLYIIPDLRLMRHAVKWNIIAQPVGSWPPDRWSAQFLSVSCNMVKDIFFFFLFKVLSIYVKSVELKRLIATFLMLFGKYCATLSYEVTHQENVMLNYIKRYRMQSRGNCYLHYNNLISEA